MASGFIAVNAKVLPSTGQPWLLHLEALASEWMVAGPGWFKLERVSRQVGALAGWLGGPGDLRWHRDLSEYAGL